LAAHGLTWERIQKKSLLVPRAKSLRMQFTRAISHNWNSIDTPQKLETSMGDMGLK